MSLFDTQSTHSQWFNHILKKVLDSKTTPFCCWVTKSRFSKFVPYENRVGGIHSEENPSDNRDPTSFNKFVF